MIISHDLGTGGNKASLLDREGMRIVSVFDAYDTYYPAPGFHEQRPADWWNAIVRSTHRLLEEAGKRVGINPNQILCIGVSGHSLGCVPLDADKNPLRATVPIWSDARADAEAAAFFERFDEKEWYCRTGNGFPPRHYPLFKILWLQRHEPDLFQKLAKVIGTKDYINDRLTGVLVTDHSYASGSGAYNLTENAYDGELINASGLPDSLLPEIVASTKVLGPLKREAAEELGLSQKTLVVAGGVDNSCMALGAGCCLPGRLYASLGSSSWIAVSDSDPLLNVDKKSYVFAHVVPGQFVSAYGIFSSGTTFRWLRDQLCRDLIDREKQEGTDPYELMIEEAKTSPPGANGLLHNPSLAGGNTLDLRPEIRGAFLGLDLRHTRADIIRSVMEGIALSLRIVLDAFRDMKEVQNRMPVVGGGARSDFWRQIYADILRIAIETTNIGQEAASLGAASLAAVGTGLWNDFSTVDRLLNIEDSRQPNRRNAEHYDRLLTSFKKDRLYLATR